MEIKEIGIIGQGFVGKAVAAGMCHAYDCHTYDINGSGNCKSIKQLTERANIIFVCLPTPMNKDGSCNISIVENVIAELNSLSQSDKQLIAVIKSTIPPGTTAMFEEKYKHIAVVFQPEFLTEAASIEDFKNQNRIVIGGKRPYSTIVKTVFDKAFPNVYKIKTSSTVAELVKYMTNCFLATKVLFANEFYQICEALDEDYDKVVEYTLYDNRIGRSHLSVPGPDFHFGVGKSCFCKDLNALIYKAEELGVKPLIMKAAWEKNLEVRPERDWELLKGRAVVNDYNDKK